MKLIIIIWILLFLSCFSILNAQDYASKFKVHLDTVITKNTLNLATKPIPSEKIFLDSVQHFINISKSNNYLFNELSLAIESVVILFEIPYTLANPLFRIYVNNFQNSNNYLIFIFNHAFDKKPVSIEFMGGIGGKNINLFDDISKDCKLNLDFRKQILNSDFLKEDYKQVNAESYQLFFKNCNDGLSIDDMIRKAGSRKKKKALKEIKYMIQQNTNDSHNNN